MSFLSLVALQGFCGSWQDEWKRLEGWMPLNLWADHILKPEVFLFPHAPWKGLLAIASSEKSCLSCPNPRLLVCCPDPVEIYSESRENLQVRAPFPYLASITSPSYLCLSTTHVY